MPSSHLHPITAPNPSLAQKTIGCVNYLNAKPLIHGLDTHPSITLRLDLPSQLLTSLENCMADIALCPVIDYQYSNTPLEIIPSGGIGCLGPTLTVRLYSRVPFKSMKHVHTDTHSHTSIVLLQIIINQRYGYTPKLVPYQAPAKTEKTPASLPESILLIGDKVINNPPSDKNFPYQLDLGEAWHQLTGLPFVFAIWMTRLDTELGDLPATLLQQRINNTSKIPQIAKEYAQQHGWPLNLAQQYLENNMRYEIEQPQIDAIDRFTQLAHEAGLIQQRQPLRIRRSAPTTR